jgi:hypothetical protein
MSRHLSACAAPMMMTIVLVAVVAAQGRGPAPQTPPPSPAGTQEVTLTGCVVAGNNAGAFILDNAFEQLGSTEKPRAFRLVGATEDLDFMPHLNHRVQIVGNTDPRAQAPTPAGGKVTERDLPLLTVKSIKDVSDTCVEK